MRPGARFRVAVFSFCAVLVPSAPAAASGPSSVSPAVDVRFVTDEAEAVLGILGKRAKGETPVLWSGDLLRAVTPSEPLRPEPAPPR